MTIKENELKKYQEVSIQYKNGDHIYKNTKFSSPFGKIGTIFHVPLFDLVLGKAKV